METAGPPHHSHLIGWLAIPIMLVAIGVLSVLMGLLGSSNPIVLGVIAYILLALVIRWFTTRHHHRGNAFVRQGRFTEGAFAYQDGYELFARHAWLDEFRFAFMLTHGRFSYREIALLNEAHCRLWNDEVESAVSLYLRTTEEFPANTVAWSAIKMFDGGVKHARRSAETATTTATVTPIAQSGTVSGPTSITVDLDEEPEDGRRLTRRTEAVKAQ